MNLSYTMQTRKRKFFRVLKGKNICQPRVFYTAKISFKNEGEIKTFRDEQRVTELVANTHTVQSI